MQKMMSFEVRTGQDLYLDYEGWLRMDMMERSMSKNREVLLKIIAKLDKGADKE